MSPKKKKSRISVIDYQNHITSVQDVSTSNQETIISSYSTSSIPTFDPSTYVRSFDKGIDIPTFRMEEYSSFIPTKNVMRYITKAVTTMKKTIIFPDNFVSQYATNPINANINNDPTNYQSNIFTNKNRLFLEDVMSLEHDTDLLYLVPTNYTENNSKLKYLVTYLNPCKCSLTSENTLLYYVFPAKTISQNVIHTYSKIDNKLATTSQSNTGLNFMLQNYTTGRKRNTFITFKDILHGQDKGIQIWAEISNIRDCKLNFRNKFRNENEQEKLLHWIFLEIYGDPCQIFYAISRFYIGVIRNKQHLLHTSTNNTNELYAHNFFDINYKNVINQIDDKFKQAIDKCYSTFVAPSQPIVPSHVINNLIHLYMTSLPRHYNFMKATFGFDKKEEMKKNSHLRYVGYYNKLLFYQFLVQTRIRSPKNLIHWALISTAASYGRGRTKNSGLVTSSCFFAHSTTIKTFIQKTKLLRENMNNKVHHSLAHTTNFMCCLDNNQKGNPRKYQRYGSSNKFVKVTGYIIKEFISDKLNLTNEQKVNISYIHQKIPSAYCMPHYEQLFEDNDESKISEYNLLGAILDMTTCNDELRQLTHLYPSKENEDIDLSGKRVEAYINICTNVHILDLIRQVCGNIFVKGTREYRFVDYTPNQEQNENIKRIIANLSNTKKNILSKKTSTFQRKVCEIWNPLYNNISKLIVPPVSLHDEIKTDGYGMALIEALTFIGMLNKCEKVLNGDKMFTYELSENWEEKNIYLCLDGLSLDRHRSFHTKLLKMPLSFTNAFKQSQVFHKALTKVVEISGPLHMAFHMLQSIYIVFKKLLQWAQTIINWKKIQATKVSDNFRLSESLCLMLYEEIFRSLFFRYMKEKENDHNGFTYISDDNLIAMKLSKGFLSYIESKVISTSDNRLKMQIYYFKMTHLFKSYKAAINDGDTLSMEHFELEFCPIFYMLDKTNYVEVILSQIERKYGYISYNQLHDLRNNSIFRYHQSSSTNTYPLHAMDSVMENINMYVKQLPIDSSQDSWVIHSPNVLLARQSINFVDQEYRRGLLNFEDAIENDELPEYNTFKHNKFVEPRKNVERKRIFEFLSKYFKGEINNRVVSAKEAHSIIEQLETKLSRKDVVDDTNVVDTNLKNIINDINQEIYVNNLNELSQILRNDIDEDDEYLNEETEEVEDISYTLQRTNDCHKFAITDILKEGKEIMVTKGIPKIRMNKKLRRQRHDTFMNDIYESIICEDNYIDQTINKLLVTRSPEEIPEYTQKYRLDE
jgi:hypothetical protein